MPCAHIDTRLDGRLQGHGHQLGAQDPHRQAGLVWSLHVFPATCDGGRMWLLRQHWAHWQEARLQLQHHVAHACQATPLHLRRAPQQPCARFCQPGWDQIPSSSSRISTVSRPAPVCGFGPSSTHGQQWLRKGSEDWGGSSGSLAKHATCSGTPWLWARSCRCSPQDGRISGGRTSPGTFTPSRGSSQDLSVCCDGKTRVLCIC